MIQNVIRERKRSFHKQYVYLYEKNSKLIQLHGQLAIDNAINRVELKLKLQIHCNKNLR